MQSKRIDLLHLKRNWYIIFILLLVAFTACKQTDTKGKNQEESLTDSAGTYLVILGTLQDGGSPHIGCKKECCKDLFTNPDPTRKVVSLGLIDGKTERNWLIEATPDIASQLKLLKQLSKFQEVETPTGIFVTHAHIGHYSGLMYLGKEALGTKEVPVYAMPRMKTFLETNGPWSQLVSQKNINLMPLADDSTIDLSKDIKVTPFTVPHRDEFSETVGYKIEGPNKTVLFIPDINKWGIWKRNIVEEIAKVDYAFIDATFFSGEEINTRNISEIPHPFVSESLELFKKLPISERNKIYFIHFNHTNPLLNPASKQSQLVIKQGFHISKFKDIIKL